MPSKRTKPHLSSFYLVDNNAIYTAPGHRTGHTGTDAATATVLCSHVWWLCIVYPYRHMLRAVTNVRIRLTDWLVDCRTLDFNSSESGSCVIAADGLGSDPRMVSIISPRRTWKFGVIISSRSTRQVSWYLYSEGVRPVPTFMWDLVRNIERSMTIFGVVTPSGAVKWAKPHVNPETWRTWHTVLQSRVSRIIHFNFTCLVVLQRRCNEEWSWLLVIVSVLKLKPYLCS